MPSTVHFVGAGSTANVLEANQTAVTNDKARDLMQLETADRCYRLRRMR